MRHKWCQPSYCCITLTSNDRFHFECDIKLTRYTHRQSPLKARVGSHHSSYASASHCAVHNSVFCFPISFQIKTCCKLLFIVIIFAWIIIFLCTRFRVTHESEAARQGSRMISKCECAENWTQYGERERGRERENRREMDVRSVVCVCVCVVGSKMCTMFVQRLNVCSFSGCIGPSER